MIKLNYSQIATTALPVRHQAQPYQTAQKPSFQQIISQEILIENCCSFNAEFQALEKRINLKTQTDICPISQQIQLFSSNIKLRPIQNIGILIRFIINFNVTGNVPISILSWLNFGFTSHTMVNFLCTSVWIRKLSTLFDV